MKSVFRFFLFISLSFVLIINTFAIDAPINMEIESLTDTSVIVEWEPVIDALMYYVYYGTESGEISDYENYSDFVEGNTVEINDLNIGTNYYFAITSLDENGEESVYSDEIVYYVNSIDSNLETEVMVTSEGDVEISTPEASVEVKSEGDVEFIFDGVSVISYNKLKLAFTNPLDNSEDSIREFKITNKADSFDTFEVVLAELSIDDNSVVELTLDRDVEIDSEYEVVVIAITSEDGKNIESGIDNVEAFTVNEIDEEVDFNAAGTESNEVSGLAGINIDASEIENTTLAAAAVQEALPATGPEHIFLLILSILLGAGVFVFKLNRA